MLYLFAILSKKEHLSMKKNVVIDIIKNNSLGYDPSGNREIHAYFITAAGTFRCPSVYVDFSSDDFVFLRDVDYFPQIANAGGRIRKISNKEKTEDFPILALSYDEIIAATLRELPFDKYNDNLY